MMSLRFCLSVAAAFTISTACAFQASATTYVYDIDFSFPILREAGLGAYADPRAGVGGFRGTVTLDDTFDTTNRFLAFDLTSYNTATAFSAESGYSYSSADPTDTYGLVDGGYWAQSFSHVFSNPSAAVACSEGLIAPSGPKVGRAYRINGSQLTIRTPYSFNAGDSNLSIQALETFGRAPLCASAGFADLGYEHTQPGNTYYLSGSLRVGGTSGSGSGSGAGGTGGGTGGTSGLSQSSPVPLPASLPLLALGAAALGLVRKRAK